MKILWGRLFGLCFVTLTAVGAAHAQTDVSASVYGAFSGTSSGNGTSQTPSNEAGYLVELRHISNPLFGLEVTYAFNRDQEHYSYNGAISTACPAPGPCPTGPSPVSVPANAHEVTADYVVSLKFLNLRPFLLAGGGILFHQPTGTTLGAQSQTQGVLVYGGGLDFTVLPHLGVRGQYRGNVYNAPQLATAFSSTKSFRTTSEPMLGVFLRF